MSEFLLRTIQRRLEECADLVQETNPIGPLRGFVDEAGRLVATGWAQDMDSPETPVRLDVCVGGRRIQAELANLHRADLRAVGPGSGCHAREVPLETTAKESVEVRRSADGATLTPARPDADRSAGRQRCFVSVLADRYRSDLLDIGLGNGRHGFEISPPLPVRGSVFVRRAFDGPKLALTFAALFSVA